MQPVGYSRLLQEPAVRALPPERLAEIRTVTRKEQIGQTLAIPASMAPAADDLLGHVLFALKHEGIDLAILAQALPQIAEPSLRTAYVPLFDPTQYITGAGEKNSRGIAA